MRAAVARLSRPPSRTNQIILTVIFVLAAILGGTMAAACIGEVEQQPGTAILPPAVTVATAYWSAVQRRDPEAVRRVLCDEDRLVLAPPRNSDLLRVLLPPGREVLGFTVTGERDTGIPVVTVRVRRSDGGRTRIVIRSTPVTRQAGIFLVCFHRLGLPLGR